MALTLALGACKLTDKKPEAKKTVSLTSTLPGSEREKLQALLDSLPEAEAPVMDVQKATSLVALPLACIDRLQKQSSYKGYLYKRSSSLRPAYEDSLSFYGCFDWHSAVNSTWTMVRILKEYPDMAVAGLIREKLNNHLSEESLKGELHFFQKVARGSFERPYGWAWYLKVYSELYDWEDEDAQKWVKHMDPLVKHFSEKMVEYLDKLDYPMRVGVHANTAFSLSMMRDYAVKTGDKKLREAIDKHALRFFRDDEDCSTAYEPSGSDFLSPCLAEASLMTRILPPREFLTWFDHFLPPAYSRSFEPLRHPVEVNVEQVSESEKEEEDHAEKTDRLGAKSHLIGLAFHRAGAFNRIADALPEDDIRVPVFRRLADLHGQRGFKAMYQADYVGTHWLGTYAVYYLLSRK